MSDGMIIDMSASTYNFAEIGLAKKKRDESHETRNFQKSILGVGRWISSSSPNQSTMASANDLKAEADRRFQALSSHELRQRAQQQTALYQVRNTHRINTLCRFDDAVCVCVCVCVRDVNIAVN